jgi:uncharacterized membrane protein
VNATDIVLTLATVTVGITAGVMFCYQIALMPGLHQLADREFIDAFQHIDRKIVNPLFVVVAFLGGAVMLVVGTALQGPGSLRFGLLVAASVVYVVGVVIVTLAWHVPRNTELDRLPVSTVAPEHAARARKKFEAPWMRLHIVRTIAATASLCMLSAALLVGSAA